MSGEEKDEIAAVAILKQVQVRRSREDRKRGLS
jgi:hypothetical protein